MPSALEPNFDLWPFMVCCLNPKCENPQNPDETRFCLSCGTQLVLLRGHYRIINLLSDEGGFGRTYLAEDIDKLNELCVVKQLVAKVKSSWAIQKSVELFEQEARRLQEMGHHSQIPTLYGYFEQDNYLYLVQQWIEGQNLARQLQQHGVWSEGEIRNLLLDILPVLQFIHARSVIHRDVKPDNIIRRRSDRKFVLIDFGASKQLAATVERGTTIGTLGYAPIEQMQGGEAYPASDLFGLGATCFHLLTQTVPHFLVLERGYEWVNDWRQYLKQPIGSNTAAVLDKLLQKDLSRRYKSATEVLQDLKPPAPKRRSPPPSPLPKKQLITVGVVLLLGLGGYGVWQSTHLRLKPVAWERLALANTLTGHSNSIYALALSPDGQTLASGSLGNIKVWNLHTRKELYTLKGHSKLVFAVAISPDGQTLVSGSGDNTIKIWNLRTGQQLRTLQGHSGYVSTVAISPDGQTLVSGSGDRTIKVWDLNTGQELRTLQGHSSSVSTVAISPDGQTLASGSEDNTIKIWDLNTGQEIRTLRGHVNPVSTVAISPDGQTLVSGSGDRTIKVWNLHTGQEVRTLQGHSELVFTVAISPDGQTLVSGSGDRTIKVWNLHTGRELRTVNGHPGGVSAVAISPDGQTIVSGGYDSNIKIWRLSRSE